MALLQITSMTTLLAAVVFAFFFLIFKLIRLGRRESFLPPGPPTVPLLGNLHLFPKKDVHFQFAKWAQEYGEIYSLKLGPSSTAVVLTSPSAIRELLDKNSSLTADRPSNHMADVVAGKDQHLVLAHYSDTWRSLRRAAHEILTPQACREHLAIQQAEATQLSYDILTDPKNFADSVRRYAHSVILSVLYGKRVPRYSTPGATAFFEAMHQWVNLLAPGAHPPVDMIPILQKVPEMFAHWKHVAQQVRNTQRKLYFGLLAEVEARIARGDGNNSFMETVCERAKVWGLDIELRSYLGGVLIEAGSDTTSAIIQSLILLLLANPEVQRKAQKEIDAVVGPDRMPTLGDIERLPYVQAIIHETHRSRPVTPVNFPHVAMADLQYGQYVIPKGTSIFANAWGVYHDERLFPDPDKFYPERFLDPESEVVKIIALAFGNGRRACPGIHLARNAVMINAMNLLWGFNLDKARNENGQVIEPDTTDYAVGISYSPNPFKCNITPRSAQHAETIRRELHTCSEAFAPFERDLTYEDAMYVRELRQNL
ncbi:hypothetical protein AcV7_003311 [Taiwanofungus camphoratus]|nr:hypothetical protein AcV7_003311 [Antrodia cinnamomea]